MCNKHELTKVKKYPENLCCNIYHLTLLCITGDCSAGFWCILGAATATPTDMVTGMACPEGRYCPDGVALPEPCPTGTWSNNTGLRTAQECLPCPGGFYCNGTGLTEPSAFCAASYYCARNASTSKPDDGGITGAPCTRAHYCPEGTADPIPCPDGTYMTDTHAAECWNCTAGHYCVSGDTPEACPPGYYCPVGTGVVWQSCPRGTFSTATGLADAAQCTACTGGYYCGQENATAVTAPCNEGYFCTEGADTPTPDANYKGTAGPCPEGHYCPAQTSIPRRCPVGTFSNVTHLKLESECTPCNYGTYCGDEGLTSPSGECSAGFYCLRGARSRNNPTEDATGGPCPIGHFCPNGTAYPLGCPSGTYNPTTGIAQCTPCPHGYHCPENSTHYSSTPCPTGHYCPLGTKAPTDYPCDAGFYNNYTGKGSVSDCIPCEPGMYCGTSGLTYPTGLCDPGWYCARGAWSPKPADYGNDTVSDTCYCANHSTGGKCQPGEFCPLGSSAPTPCSTGKLSLLNILYSFY